MKCPSYYSDNQQCRGGIVAVSLYNNYKNVQYCHSPTKVHADTTHDVQSLLLNETVNVAHARPTMPGISSLFCDRPREMGLFAYVTIPRTQSRRNSVFPECLYMRTISNDAWPNEKWSSRLENSLELHLDGDNEQWIEFACVALSPWCDHACDTGYVI